MISWHWKTRGWWGKTTFHQIVVGVGVGASVSWINGMKQHFLESRADMQLWVNLACHRASWTFVLCSSYYWDLMHFWAFIHLPSLPFTTDYMKALASGRFLFISEIKGKQDDGRTGGWRSLNLFSDTNHKKATQIQSPVIWKRKPLGRGWVGTGWKMRL